MSSAQSNKPRSALGWDDQSGHPLDWNGPINRPFDAFPDEAKSRPIIDILEAVVGRYPQRIAVEGPDASITYGELWRAATAWAERIANATAPGDLVGILVPVSTTLPVAMLACLAAARPFVALDPEHLPEWIARVLADSRPSLLLVPAAHRRTASVIPGAMPTLVLNGDTGCASPNWRPARLAPDEAAFVLFTSGSTGKPKGIVNSQQNLLQRVSQSINAAHINRHDRFLTLSSLCTIVGVRDLFTALLTGASVCLFDAQNSGAREILRVIRDRRISILFAFPALLRSVVENSQAGAGDDLRLVRVGGDTTLWSDVALLRAWMSPGTSIQLVYAATEAPIMQWFVGEIAAGDDPRIPIGYPLPGNGLAVVDELGAPTKSGEVGELLVRSPYVALGIWSQGRLCETAAIQTDAGDRHLRTLKTGDLVRRRPDGLYDRIGRCDRQLKIRGVRVELDGIEAAIRRHVSVRDVAVLARTDEQGRAAKIVAYVEAADTAADDVLGELAAMMRRTVPSHMRPWRFYTTPIIPRLLNSKLDLRALRAMDLARSRKEADSQRTLARRTALEGDPIEIIVTHVWREILGLALATREDDFFDLGGDSLRAITMTAAIEKALGRELPMNLINQAPSFAAFCATLRENAPARYSPLVVLKEGHDSPPLFLVHGVGGCVMELFALGRKMTWPGPVIGVQARGLDGGDPPHKTVEAMTEEYLKALKARQSKGPYFLCGYSFGGLVAFELARTLRDRGDEVAFVGLLATLPPGHRFLRLWAWVAYLYRRLAQRLASPKNRVIHALAPTSVLDFAAGAMRDLRAVALSAFRASAAYRPGPYDGALTIFEPGSRDLGLPESAHFWSRHARSLQRHSLQGRHDDMLLGANAEAAARMLSRCLEAAIEATPRRAPPQCSSIAHGGDDQA